MSTGSEAAGTPLVAITSGRGKTGAAVATAVEAAGGRVRRLGRAELEDPAAAFAGCALAYLIAPNLHDDEPGFIHGLLDAARSAGVQRVVYHSVATPYAPAMPHHFGKAEAERLVRRSGLPWTILQPCAYVQNFVLQLAGPEPRVTVPYDPDREFGMVDLADVAVIAARAVLDPGFAGATFELGGAMPVSVRDVATAASSVLAQPVPLEQISVEAWQRGPGASLSAHESAWLTAMFGYYDRFGLPCGGIATAAVLGREPTSLAETLRRELSVAGG